MKRDYLLLALLLVGNITFAQSPIERALNTINRSSAEATINFLASDELQGREAGVHGSRVTSEVKEVDVECCGQHEVCERDSLLAAVRKK